MRGHLATDTLSGTSTWSTLNFNLCRCGAFPTTAGDFVMWPLRQYYRAESLDQKFGEQGQLPKRRALYGMNLCSQTQFPLQDRHFRSSTPPCRRPSHETPRLDLLKL